MPPPPLQSGDAGVRGQGRKHLRILGIHHKIFEWPNGEQANMILDDGGDATLLVHLGAKAETDPSVFASPEREEETVLFEQIKQRLAAQPDWYSARPATH